MPDTQLSLMEEQPVSISLNPVVQTMNMIAHAAANGGTPEMLRELFLFKKEVEAHEAEKAFYVAFTAFKNEPLTIIRDKENKQYSKPDAPAMYTSLENMVAVVTPILSKHELSASWEIDQTNGVTVTCVVTHVLGHSKRVPMTAGPDTSGAKNPLQQIKSTLTYLKVATFESACGLASTYGNLSDDGNASGKSQPMDDCDIVAHLDNIAAAPTQEKLRLFFKAAYNEAQAKSDKKAMESFIVAKDRRKAELA